MIRLMLQMLQALKIKDLRKDDDLALLKGKYKIPKTFMENITQLKFR